MVVNVPALKSRLAFKSLSPEGQGNKTFQRQYITSDLQRSDLSHERRVLQGTCAGRLLARR